MPLLTLLLSSIMKSIALLLYILIPLIDLIYCVVLGRAAQFLLFYCISYRAIIPKYCSKSRIRRNFCFREGNEDFTIGGRHHIVSKG